MIVLFAALIIISVVLIAPGWLIARRQKPQGPVLLFMAVPGILLWMILTAAGIGAQSLSNIVEVFMVTIVSVFASYIKFFILDRWEMKQSATIALLIVLGVTLLLRFFMPVMPE